MPPEVTRRDFLNGAMLAIVAGLSPRDLLAGALTGAPYPPAGHGFRGSTPGSFEVAHALRDGRVFDTGDVSFGERYDLMVIGAGISGLAAAWFYRREKPNARILLLEANDDFGGHAQRNEFEVAGRKLIGYGGSEALQSPHSLYSREARIGISTRPHRWRTSPNGPSVDRGYTVTPAVESLPVARQPPNPHPGRLLT